MFVSVVRMAGQLDANKCKFLPIENDSFPDSFSKRPKTWFLHIKVERSSHTFKLPESLRLSDLQTLHKDFLFFIL